MTAKVDYGVGITNAFELLEDETDESRQTANKAPVSKGTVAKGKVEPTKRTTAAPIARVEGRQENKGQNRPRDNEHKNDRMGSAPRRDYVVGEEKSAPVAAQEPGMEGFSKVESRDRHHERRGGAGRKEGQIPGGKFKRQFDRRSGTGRGKEISKGGAGKHNWGSDKGEANTEASTENQTQEEEGAEQVQAPPPPKEETPEEKEERLAREKEEGYKLLDEYLEEKKKNAPSLALPPPRTANEGTQNQWKDYVPIQKDAPTGVKIANITKKDVKKEEKKEEKKGEEKKEKKEKISEDLLGFHAPPRAQSDRRERGERSDRGGERRGPKGQRSSGPRKTGSGNTRSDTRSIEVNDELQFPSLATKA